MRRWEILIFKRFFIFIFNLTCYIPKWRTPSAIELIPVKQQLNKPEKYFMYNFLMYVNGKLLYKIYKNCIYISKRHIVFFIQTSQSTWSYCFGVSMPRIFHPKDFSSRYQCFFFSARLIKIHIFLDMFDSSKQQTAKGFISFENCDINYELWINFNSLW